MNNIYFFTKSNFKLKYKEQIFELNKNSIIKLTDISNSDQVEVYNNENKLLINLNNLNACNFYSLWQHCGNNYLEIICSSFNNLIQKINGKDFEVFIYQNAIRLINNEVCHTHAFFADNKSYAMKYKDLIYIFNSKNLVLFNSLLSTFSYLKVEKFIKNNKKIEILCKIPQNIGYFLHFLVNFDTNTVQTKKLKNDNLDSKSPLPYLIFNLCKYDFEEAKNLFDKSIEYKKIKEYLNSFDQILEIENKYYVCNEKEFTEIKFQIKDGIIIDVD